MKRMYRIAGSLILGLAVLVTGCSPQAVTPVQPTPVPGAAETEELPVPTLPVVATPVEGSLLISDKPRVQDVPVDPGQVDALVTSNSAFAINLYQQLSSGEENIFFSPYSISLALAMTSAGAKNATLDQMMAALQFDFPQAALHPAFNSLDLALERAPASTPEDEGAFQLNIANSIWGQAGFPFLPEFLDTLAENYGTGLQTADFTNPEPVRATINQWVANQTKDKIQDLFPEGSITDMTRMVLANAIYFKAAWANPFEKEQTKPADFTLLDGSVIQVPTMHLADGLGYLSGEGFQAVSLPYMGGTASMIAILPDTGTFKEFEARLTYAKLEELRSQMEHTQVILSMPRFKIESSFGLKDTLSALGMEDAFLPDAADFSGMDGQKDLYISSVLHKAYVNVDEEGTEAAAATGVVVGLTSMPTEQVEVKLDRPFMLMIVDETSGSILFMGRVTNP